VATDLKVNVDFEMPEEKDNDSVELDEEPQLEEAANLGED